MPKTALELLTLADRMEPGRAFLDIRRQLKWQAEHGRRPGHIRQYLEAAFYQQYPRQRKTPEAMAAREKLATLTRGIGRAG